MPDEEKTLDAPRRRRGCLGLGCVWELLIIIGLLVFVAVNWPNVHPTRDKPKEAQVRSNLHDIQLALERYAVDHDGQYPLYLIGGQGEYSTYLEDQMNAFINITDCPDPSLLADPLLREGYIEAYPKNPFATKGSAIQRFQADKNDPLRNGTDAAKMHGTRFGPYCTISGNVLGDRRYSDFTVFTADGASTVYPTYADMDYHAYDIWETNRPQPFFPGEFFYRSSPLNAGEPVPMDGALPSGIARSYMLGGYGAIRTKGKDVLGPDPFGVNDASPYGIDDNGLLRYGNPNGIRDAIILVLVPGED